MLITHSSTFSPHRHDFQKSSFWFGFPMEFKVGIARTELSIVGRKRAVVIIKWFRKHQQHHRKAAAVIQVNFLIFTFLKRPHFPSCWKKLRSYGTRQGETHGRMLKKQGFLLLIIKPLLLPWKNMLRMSCSIPSLHYSSPLRLRVLTTTTTTTTTVQEEDKMPHFFPSRRGMIGHTWKIMVTCSAWLDAMERNQWTERRASKQAQYQQHGQEAWWWRWSQRLLFSMLLNSQGRETQRGRKIK